LYFNSLTGQDQSQTVKDTVQLTELEKKIKKVDSLRKYTRSQFYGNNFDLTIEVADEALKLAREINDTKTIFAIYSILGNAFLKIEDTLQAKRIFSEAVLEAESIKAAHASNPDITPEVLYTDDRSIITARIDLGNYYALQEKAEPAIKIYNETIPLAEKIKDTSHLFILNFNIAELNLDLKNIELADHYVTQTNNYITKGTVDAYRAVAKLNMGRLYVLKNVPFLAIKELQECIELAKSSGYIEAQIEGYEFYSKAEAMRGRYDAAYHLVQKVDSLKSEKYKTDKIEAIETVTAKFKLKQFQQELQAKTLQNEINNQTTKRETTILWVKIASAILLIFSGFLFVSYRKRKKLLVDLIAKNKQYLIAKEESEKLARAKTVLFSNITHQLRTPMYGIIGISDILIKDKKLKGHGENLKSLKFSANYLFSLINNVLLLTQLDRTKKDELERVTFDLEKLVNNVVKSSKFINEEHPNKYHVSIGKNVPKTLIGDQVKLSQVLINLVGNAAKFTDNGTVSIQIEREADVDGKIALQFLISDTGIGISREKQKHIFDEFAQTESDNKSHGMGLGLPLVKKILALHGSEIEINSEENKGTEVRFGLCFESVDADTQKKQKTPRADNKRVLNNNKILVVDDNKINLLITRQILEIFGATVSVADSGNDAILMTKENSYDLILMDINMPEMNGFEATEAIRAFDPKIPIIALTAVEKEKVVGDHSFHLLNDFIIKPYKNDVFIEIISKHIRA
jgi:signal transduction histidine kinase